MRWMPVLFAAVLVLLVADSKSVCAAEAGLSVAGLRCEYLINPLGLDVIKPRLSWRITSDKRGTTQSAYRVLVASSLNLLAGDQGDIWDTGKVSSDQSIQLEYAGKSLVSGEKVYWKVQVWDRTPRASAWSEPALWSMGLLTPADWKGEWIGQSLTADDAKSKTPPPAPLLRKNFNLAKTVKRAIAYVCSLGYYVLYLDGSKVGDHVLDPPVTEFNKRALYVTYDVTDQLSTGANTVGVQLGSSWYDTTAPDSWQFEKAIWRALPQLRMQIDIEYTDGSREQVVSDGSWKMNTGAVLFDQTRVGETYDARLEKQGWSKPDYDQSGWAPVAVREGATGVVSASNVEPIRVMATIKPVKITQPKPGVYVSDMGQNLAGWPKLTVRGPAGTVVHLKCGERLFADGTVDTRNISVDNRGSAVQCDTYTLKGEGTETYEPRFTYHGFQYVQVEGLPGEGSPDTILAQVVGTSFATSGSFECSDETINKIENAAVWTYKSNFVGIPTDCPHREKNGWTGDAQLACELGLEHFHAEAAYTQWIQSLEDCMRDDGKLQCICPSTGWGYNRLDGPAWESAYELIPWEMYQQSGDRRILESHYAGFKKWIDWYTRGAKNHIVTYGLGDWAPVKTKTRDGLTSTAYYYRDLTIISETANLLGKDDEAKQYAGLASEVRKAFIATFFDPATGQVGSSVPKPVKEKTPAGTPAPIILDGTQAGLSCALYQGLFNSADRDRIVGNLVEKVHQSDGHIDTGILGAKYILRALSDNGRADVAWQIATYPEQPGWVNWIHMGATTLWEEWDGSLSRNHIMFGDISSWFVEYVGGIRYDPAGPGYKKSIIHPLILGTLTRAKATRDCMYGTIISEWEREGNGLTLDITIPANTTATVFIPTNDLARITESGLPANSAGGVHFSKMEGDTAVFEIGSGSYHFSSTVK
jgi:alpha-L-rhamnosidase